MDINFNGDMESVPVETYTDKDGKVVERSEVEAYDASIPTDPTPTEGAN